MFDTGARRVARLLAVVGWAALLADPALAHVGSLSGSVGTASVPLWLVATTGGGVVGVSFLFASFMTDHELIRAINATRLALPGVPSVGRVLRILGRVGGVATLAVVLASAFFGPTDRFGSFAILVVWAGWWAGYIMTVYLVGNSWPAINPWRTLAELLPRVGDRTYPARLGVWPSVAALLVLVWIEVVSPLAGDPRLLGAVVLGYTAVTLAGASLYGVDDWFDYVDPIARALRWYGRVAPVQRTDDGVEFRLPGAALADGVEDRFDETPFVVALLWVTTYDGLVSTVEWNAAVTPLVRAIAGLLGATRGGPVEFAVALAVYSVGIVAGYGVFLGAYRLANRKAPEYADSFLRADVLGRRFLPALVPIAAGYHVAHFLGYFLTLAPALGMVLTSPFAAPLNPQVLALPSSFRTLQLAFVVLGHVLAIWVAHAIAFELFPGKLKPIRSQYPYTLVMVFYTFVSMWIVARPFSQPAFI